jgi:hypothetical protein
MYVCALCMQQHVCIASCAYGVCGVCKPVSLACKRAASTVIAGAGVGLLVAGMVWATPLPPIFQLGPPPPTCTVFHSPNYVPPIFCERSHS